MQENIVKEGDNVLLILQEGKRYLIKVNKGEIFHTHRGYIKHDELINKEYGSCIKSSLNYDFFIAKPTLYDFIRKIQRKTQIIYPKDSGYIILIGNISSGSKIVEIGTGSGALTCVLANAVKPNGHVYTYEIKEEFLEIAKNNVKKLNLENYVTFKLKNAMEGIDEKDVDCIIIDIADPWNLIGKIKENLKGAGIIIIFCLTVSQLEKTLKALYDNDFVDINTVEILEREYQTELNKIRPKTRMIGHTGFIIWARRKIART
jgi:tRNA (adenine57-N1/adenine58-N1)-methyltransferase